MPKLPFYWIDAFTSQPFGGNPAAVVPLDAWLDDELLQQMARQHGLSETVYYVPTENDSFGIRWFTPGREVDLCGHATLAAATVIFLRHPDQRQIGFQSQSGALRVEQIEGGRLQLDFPNRPPREISDPDVAQKLQDALGAEQIDWIGQARDLLVVLPSQSAVAKLTPDFLALAEFDAVTVTARGDDCDFVSRHFAPGYAIDEDPVTGSTHSTLTPYWSDRLGKIDLHARQISERGGELWCTLAGDRVKIAGRSVVYLTGELEF